MDKTFTVAIERTWLAIDANGGEHTLVLAIGTPQPRKNVDWEVQVSLGILEPRPFTIYGVDSWQAMHLAMRFTTQQVADYAKRGWRFYWPDGEDEALPSNMFQ